METGVVLKWRVEQIGCDWCKGYRVTGFEVCVRIGADLSPAGARCGMRTGMGA